MPSHALWAQRLSVALLVLGLIGVGASLRETDAEAESEEAEEGEKPGAFPDAWFHSQRAYPGVDVPPAARSLALEQARALRAVGERGPEPPLDPTWVFAGPTNIGGRLTAVAALPGGATMYLGTAAGGVFRSTNSGSTFAPIFDGVGAGSIGAVAIDPSDANRIYVGTGEANASGDSFAGEGLFRSTDGGAHWASLGLEDSRHIGRIAVDPSNPNRIFVAALGALFTKTPERGLYRSTDGGASFSQVLFLTDSTACVDVALDPSNPSRVYAAMWERLRTPKYRRAGGLSSGIHRSLDGGETWTRLSSGLPPVAQNVGRIGLAVAASSPQTLYAVYADDPGYFLGLYKSTNGGDTWTRTNDGALSDLFSSFGWYFGNVRVSPTDPNRVYTMGLDIFRSTNGGTSWSNLTNGSIHVDQHDLWIDPSSPMRCLAGNDGGLYRSTNGGTSWSALGGLPISQFYAGAIDPSNPQRLYGGMQDNGTGRTLTGGTSDWNVIYGGDGFYCLVDPRNSNVIYAEYQYGGLGKSVNGGSSFSDATSGINGGDRRNWSMPVVMDPTNPDRLYTGTYRVYRTNNAAGSWSAISGDLTGGTGGATLVYATITTIAVAPSDPNRLYVGTDDARVWTSSNGGGAWQNVSAGLPNRWVTRIAVDPDDPLLAYVAHSGYRQDEPTTHLHRTTDAGQSWTAIDAGLPEAPVNALAVDPDLASTLYVGTDVGVYVTRDGGDSWSDLAPGLPIVVIHDLMLHAPTRKLVAATHGRSMYSLALPSASAVAGEADPARLELRLASANPWSRSSGGVARLELRAAPGELVRLELFDASGRRVRDLGARSSGAVIELDGRDESGHALGAGIYFARASSGDRVVSARWVVVG